MLEIKKYEFVKSVVSIKDCPKEYYPELAFIGRSNVGKSSLINLLCNNKHLAKVSEKPGKTQTINHFLINGNWYLVDLPGYGYAKVSKENRKNFQIIIEEYLQNRKTLKCIFVLLDIRHEMQHNDLLFLQWLGKNRLPFAIILTKADKLKKSELKKQQIYFENELTKHFEEQPNIFITSSINKQGREDVLEFIEYLLEQ